MKINNINTYTQPNFKSSYRTVWHNITQAHQNTTEFFKYDLDWGTFVEYLKETYKNEPKVNVYSLACSDGTEAYSLAMLLTTKLGKDAEKFFPIIAVDNDPYIIGEAESGFVNCSSNDELTINKFTGNQFNLFFERTGVFSLSDPFGKNNEQVMFEKMKVKPELRDKIHFIEAGVEDVVEKIEPENSVVMCRNCWCYFDNTKDTDKIITTMDEKLGKTSILVVGNYDHFACPVTLESCHGFSMHPTIKNIFDRSGSGYFDLMKLLGWQFIK